MQGRSALLVYIEPTPYRLGLIRELTAQSGQPVEVLFAAPNVSQPWDIPLQGTSGRFLPAGTASAVREVRAKLSTGNYGLVHLAGWSGRPILMWTWMLAWWYRVPIFVESDSQIAEGAPVWKRAIKRILYPQLFRMPRKMFAAGSRQVAYFRHYGVESERIVVDRLTVDVSDIMARSKAIRESGAMNRLRKEFGLSAGQTVFIFVGRLEPHKGIDCLLDAFAAIERAGLGAALLVVGDGSARKRVEARARQSDSIRYAGRLGYEQVVRAYNCADVAVVPSSFEPWGLVVNEAMAAGLPVIASDRVGCVDDLVRNGETGLVFRSGSASELGVAMERLLRSPAERARTGAAARRLISGWTLQAQARTIVDSWNR